ncbi:hypothetical protein WJX73_007528 [Symbiochloris irregularis]|uniref:Flagellar associated protein n=1 Tax=Symbiochloris irregularis TaxID=706552 RepID=A0AAW1Q111_9CHLO
MARAHYGSFSGAPAPGQDGRCGVVRDSMRTNPLIQAQYCELGQKQRTLFNDAASASVFGKQSSSGREGVRELINNWEYWTPDAAAGAALDFKSMNKLAAVRGATGTAQQRTFRAQHPRHVKRPATPSMNHPAAAPSTGDAQSNVLLPILQGAYQDDWIKANIAHSYRAQPYIPPGKTLASQGHATALRDQTKMASTQFNGTSSVDTFKMPRFLSVPALVDTRRT